MEPNPAYEMSRQSRLNSKRRFRIAIIVVGCIAALAIARQVALHLGLVPTNEPAEHTSAATPARKPCADIGHFTGCVTKAVLRTSVSDGFDGVAAQGNTAFILVRVLVSNNGKSTDRIGWSSFLLRSGSRRWEPDTHVTMKLFGTGYDPLSMLEEVQPGTSVAGWLAFFAPREIVADAYLAFTPGLVRTAELALPGLGSTPATCSVDGKDGQCVDVATCAGRHVAGLCEGPANVQCCLP